MELSNEMIQHLIVAAKMEDDGEIDGQDLAELWGERNLARLVLDDLGVNYND